MAFELEIISFPGDETGNVYFRTIDRDMGVFTESTLIGKPSDAYNVIDFLQQDMLQDYFSELLLNAPDVAARAKIEQLRNSFQEAWSRSYGISSDLDGVVQTILDVQEAGTLEELAAMADRQLIDKALEDLLRLLELLA